MASLLTLLLALYASAYLALVDNYYFANGAKVTSVAYYQMPKYPPKPFKPCGWLCDFFQPAHAVDRKLRASFWNE